MAVNDIVIVVETPVKVIEVGVPGPPGTPGNLLSNVTALMYGETLPPDLPLGGVWFDTSTTPKLPPSIASIPQQGFVSTEGITVPITIADPHDVLACTLSVTSGDSDAIPTTGITFGGTGANRTMTIPPLASPGQSLLTVTVTNADGMTAATSFLAVGALTSFTVTASAGANGSIAPTGAVTVQQGASQTFTAVPDNGFAASGLTVDGVFMAGISSYTFNNVQGEHTIVAAFIISAPTGLAVVAADTQMTVSWNAVAGATSYNLYFTSDGSTPTKNSTKLTGVTSPYAHSGRTNEVTYKYVATAVGSTGESAESAVASGVFVPGLFLDTFTGADGSGASATYWNTLATYNPRAGSYGNIQTNAFKFHIGAPSGLAALGIIAKTLASAANGRKVAVQILNQPAIDGFKDIVDLLIVGANTTYPSGFPATDYALVRWTKVSGVFKITFFSYNAAGVASTEQTIITGGIAANATLNLALVWRDATHVEVFINGASYGQQVHTAALGAGVKPGIVVTSGRVDGTFTDFSVDDVEVT